MMISCGVCLENVVEVIHLFNEEGKRLNIPSIIRQHFWFELHEENPILKRICRTCWEQIANFHNFYTTIKEAHKKMEEMRYKQKDISRADEVYTIDDSDDEVLNVSANHSLETNEHNEQKPQTNSPGYPLSDYFLDGDSKEIGREENWIIEHSDGSNSEVVLTFLKQEHEALLDEYTYVDVSPKDAVDYQNSDHKDSKTNSDCEKDYFEKALVSDALIKNEFIGYLSGDDKEEIHEPKKYPKYTTSRLEDERTQREDSLIAHYITLQCEQCMIKFELFNDLNNHYRAAHNVCGYVRCCNKKLPTRSYILDHINQHINPEKYRCKECDKSFSTQYAINNHLAMKHAPESLKIFKCKECPERFTNDFSLNKHLLEHKNKDEKRLYCTDCRKMFQSPEMLEKHRDVHHKRISGHICHVCGSIIKGKKAFGKHIREHAKVMGTTVMNDPVCPICGKLSASIKTLRHHIRYVHTAMRPHKCLVCGKMFKIRQKLKDHMATHEVGVSLSCPYCPKRFRSKIHVYSHKYRMHKAECDIERNSRLEAAANGTYDCLNL